MGYASLSEGGDRFNQLNGSLALGIGFNEVLGGYVEIFGLLPDDPSGADAAFFNGGVTVLANPNLQFDVRAGIGFSDAEPDYFAGPGVKLAYLARAGSHDRTSPFHQQDVPPQTVHLANALA